MPLNRAQRNSTIEDCQWRDWRGRFMNSPALLFSRPAGPLANSHARQGVGIYVYFGTGPKGRQTCRTFGAPFPFHVFHALTGVAIDFRPFGPMRHDGGLEMALRVALKQVVERIGDPGAGVSASDGISAEVEGSYLGHAETRGSEKNLVCFREV